MCLLTITPTKVAELSLKVAFLSIFLVSSSYPASASWLPLAIVLSSTKFSPEILALCIFLRSAFDSLVLDCVYDIICTNAISYCLLACILVKSSLPEFYLSELVFLCIVPAKLVPDVTFSCLATTFYAPVLLAGSSMRML